MMYRPCLCIWLTSSHNPPLPPFFFVSIPEADPPSRLPPNRNEVAPFTAEELARLPTLAFKLPDGPTLELEGKDYMMPVADDYIDLIDVDIDPDEGLTYYFLGIVPNESKSVSLLGQLVLRRYYTEYDVANERLGFAPAVADCQAAVGL
jgi:hypothetical protein